MRILLLLTLLFSFSSANAKETIVAGMSQNRVAITATFVGSEILIFGAAKRDAPAPTDKPLEVIVVVEGPSEPVTVRKKNKRLGIWVNTEGVEVASAPSFYAVATSAALDDSLTTLDDLRHLVSVNRSIHMAPNAQTETDPSEFIGALVRIRREAGLYKLLENSVNLREDTLFDTRVALPANLTEGEYRTRILLTRDGYVTSEYETIIAVQKVGLERWIYNLAHEKPLMYGLLSLFIAIAAGWGASALFRLILRN